VEERLVADLHHFSPLALALIIVVSLIHLSMGADVLVDKAVHLH